jgi:circadian clock protein KaiB
MPPPTCVLELYVTDSSALSQRAIANLQRLCADSCEADWDVRIVDVLEEPEKAEEARVVATPTLLRLVPAPERRIIGDLSDREQTLIALDLPQQGASSDGRAHGVER